MSDEQRANIIRHMSLVVRHMKALLSELKTEDSATFDLALNTLLTSLNNGPKN
jgi:hypothetical protein